MSFTSDVKKELTRNLATTGALLALVRMNGSVGIFNGLTLSITTENAGTAKYIYQMLQELYEIHAEIRVHQKTTLSKNRVYTVFITEGAGELLDELSLADSLMLDNGVLNLLKMMNSLKKTICVAHFCRLELCITLKKGSINYPSQMFIRNMLRIYKKYFEILA